MFDFAPVGVAVATLGVIFVAVIGWRLVPARKSAAGDSFDSGSYLTEVRVPEKSKAVGLTLRAFEAEIEDSGAQIIGLVRDEVRMTAPSGGRRIKAGDVLVQQADVDALAEALSVFGIKLEEEALRGSISPVFCGCRRRRASVMALRLASCGQRWLLAHRFCQPLFPTKALWRGWCRTVRKLIRRPATGRGN